MALQTFRQEYLAIPIVTRIYTTACIFTSLAVVSSFFIHFVDVYFIFESCYCFITGRSAWEPYNTYSTQLESGNWIGLDCCNDKFLWLYNLEKFQLPIVLPFIFQGAPRHSLISLLWKDKQFFFIKLRIW